MVATTLPVLPSIHLNGSDAKSLAEGYHAARRSVEDAIKALSNVGLHPRDYYTQDRDGSTWRAARSEQEARFDALKRIAAELAAIEEHCVDAIPNGRGL